MTSGLLVLCADSNEVCGVQLPLELSVLGAPGCMLHVRVDDVIASWGGEFGFPSWALPASLTIPNDSALRGAVVFLQALRFGRLFSLLGTTNALRITIGA